MTNDMYIRDSTVFSVDTISKADMKELANSIEEYIDVFENVMVIPEDLREEYEKQIKEGIKRCKKLVKKLRDGDKSVFKDPEDVEPIW